MEFVDRINMEEYEMEKVVRKAMEEEVLSEVLTEEDAAIQEEAEDLLSKVPSEEKEPKQKKKRKRRTKKEMVAEKKEEVIVRNPCPVCKSETYFKVSKLYPAYMKIGVNCCTNEECNFCF